MGQVMSSVFSWWAPQVKAIDGSEVQGPNADVPDKTTGLTPRQVAVVRGTWDLVKPDLKDHGVNFFLMLFAEHPILQTRFKGFAGKTPEQLKATKRLAAHGSSVLLAITGLVDNLEDTSCLVEMLKTTGRNHLNRKIPKNDFELLAPVLVKYLRENLGAAWSDVAETGWVQVMKAVNSVVYTAYDNPDEE